MGKCVNENCRNDPTQDINPVLWGCDGDFACSPECFEEAIKQRDYFFNVILPDDKKWTQWLEG